MKNISKIEIKSFAKLSAPALFFLMLTNLVSAQNTNFSGEWKLLKEKSEMGILPDSVVAQNIHFVPNTDITITRSFIKPSGKTSYSEKLSVDGKSSESSPEKGIKRVAQILWSPDKTQMIEKASISGAVNGEAYEFKSTETWSLSADKRQLIIDRVLVDEEETVKNHLVYEKQ